MPIVIEKQRLSQRPRQQRVLDKNLSPSLRLRMMLNAGLFLVSIVGLANAPVGSSPQSQRLSPGSYRIVGSGVFRRVLVSNNGTIVYDNGPRLCCGERVYDGRREWSDKPTRHGHISARFWDSRFELRSGYPLAGAVMSYMTSCL